MTDYLVTWKIDIEGDTPENAAYLAKWIQQDHESVALHFEVTNKETGETVSVYADADE